MTKTPAVTGFNISSGSDHQVQAKVIFTIDSNKIYEGGSTDDKDCALFFTGIFSGFFARSAKTPDPKRSRGSLSGQNLYSVLQILFPAGDGCSSAFFRHFAETEGDDCPLFRFSDAVFSGNRLLNGSL